MSKATYVGIKNDLGAVEARRVKNICVKQGGILKQNVVPKGLINGSLKKFIDYYLDWFISDTTSFGVRVNFNIFVDMDKQILIIAFESNGFPSKFRIVTFRISDGSIISNITTPDSREIYGSGVQHWYENGKLFYISSYQPPANKYLMIVSIDVFSGNYHDLYKGANAGSDEYYNRTNICKNKNLFFCTYHHGSANWNISNHNKIIDLTTMKSSYENNGYSISKILPYKDYFIGTVRNARDDCYYVSQYKNFNLTGDSFQARYIYILSSSWDDIDLDIDYNENLGFIIDSSGFLHKIDLDSFTEVLKKDVGATTYYITSISIDKTAKEIYITYNWSSDVKVYDYDFNLIKTLEININKNISKAVKVDDLGLTIVSSTQIQRINFKGR